MRVSFLALLLLIVASTLRCASADPSETERIVRGAALNDAGRFRDAIEAVEPLVRADKREGNQAAIGIAWNIRGLALQSMDEGDEARRSYDRAIQTLRALPEQRWQYAAALENLGSLEISEGRAAESKSLRVRAEQMYAADGDHAGVARVLDSLALIAMKQNKTKEARRCISDAFREESLLPEPDLGDLASLYSTQALEQERENKSQLALAAIQRAIEIWKQRYGPEYYLLAAGYSLRGRAYDGLRDYPHAIEDMQRALTLMEGDGESRLRIYSFTELSYAQVLRHAGRKEEAARMNSSGNAALDALRRARCESCTVSVESISRQMPN